jgi:hypothetical protein
MILNNAGDGNVALFLSVSATHINGCPATEVLFDSRMPQIILSSQAIAIAQHHRNVC